MMMKAQSLFAFLAGAAVGAAVALLVAPDSGVNTRKKIARTIRQEKEKALERVVECLEETAHQVSRKAAKSAKE